MLCREDTLSDVEQLDQTVGREIVFPPLDVAPRTTDLYFRTDKGPVLGRSRTPVISIAFLKMFRMNEKSPTSLFSNDIGRPRVEG